MRFSDRKDLQSRFKTGNECFQVQGTSTDFTLFDYWQWSGSDLLSNTQRGIIAEFLVAKALGVADSPRLEWGSYDLSTATGQKIEVKSASYHQSWSQERPSDIRFNISPAKWLWDPDTNTSTYHEIPVRTSDAYVFCLLGSLEHSEPDPLDLDQWTFYVISRDDLESDCRVKRQKTIGINPLKVLVKRVTGRCDVGFSDLRSVIEQIRCVEEGPT